MSQELGDSPIGYDVAVTKPSDGTNLSRGDFVTVNASNQISPTGDGDDVFGVVKDAANQTVDLSALSAGDLVSVVIHGDINANVASAVTEGDLVETTATAGQVTQNGAGTEQDVDEGGTATYTIASSTAMALSDAGGTAPTGESLSANVASIWVSK